MSYTRVSRETAESSPSEKDRFFQEMNEALKFEQGIEEPVSSSSFPDAWTDEAEEVFSEAAEEHYHGAPLLEEIAGLEAESEQFEAETRVLRENLEHDPGEGE